MTDPPLQPDPVLDRSRRGVFSGSAAGYERGRPGYPPALFDLLSERCGLAPHVRVLEIGPGSGQATEELLRRGASVVAVELGAEFGDLLRSKFERDRLEVVVGAFETVEVAGPPFDLIAAGTSFHWVPTDVGLQRCGQLLRRGGTLALWWNFFGDPDRPDPFHDRLQPLLRKHAPQLAENDMSGSPGAHPYALDAAARIAEINRSGCFGTVEHEVFAWTGVHSADEIRAMFATFSPWLALAPDVRTPLLDELEVLARQEFDDRVERPYLTSLYTAARA